MIKDYDIEILYHPGKSNVVADAWSRKMVQEQFLSHLTAQRELQLDLVRPEIEVWLQRVREQLCTLEILSSLDDIIRTKQIMDPFLSRVRDEVTQGKAHRFVIHEDGMIRFRNRLCVPADEELINSIMREAHATRYSIHPGSSKMYKDLKQYY